jgi:hypothetical protein
MTASFWDLFPARKPHEATRIMPGHPPLLPLSATVAGAKPGITKCPP